MQKLLITGNKGHIGKILAPALAKDYAVAGLDIEDADISDLKSLEKYFKKIGKIDIIIHLAADSYPFASWDLVLKNNIIGARNVYECAVKFKIPKIIFASSVHAKKLDGWYGWSKAAGEILAKTYSHLYGLKTKIIRLGDVRRELTPTEVVKIFRDGLHFKRSLKIES